jgi:hypothetical protein
MAVGEQDMIDGYDLIGGPADIEADVELRNCDDGFFAGHGITDYFQLMYFNPR